MADQSAPPPEPVDDPVDLGEPIAELADLGWSPGARFNDKVTGGIERRLLTGRLLDVAWSAPLMVLLELLRIPFESLSASRRE
jgi:hypothetical protein